MNFREINLRLWNHWSFPVRLEFWLKHPSACLNLVCTSHSTWDRDRRLAWTGLDLWMNIFHSISWSNRKYFVKTFCQWRHVLNDPKVWKKTKFTFFNLEMYQGVEILVFTWNNFQWFCTDQFHSLLHLRHFDCLQSCLEFQQSFSWYLQ